MINSKTFIQTIFTWMPLAIATTLICGLIYLTTQQNYRLNANDPQIQLAQDISKKLSQGQSIQNYSYLSDHVDIDKSLAPFVMIFNDEGNPAFSTAYLNGKIPQLPTGVFDYVRQHNEDRFTWQPQSGVREAVVVERYQGRTNGFVVVGRSLKEVEVREAALEVQVGIIWLTTLVLTLGAYLFIRPLSSQIK